jgi:putative two-component system response regulator
LHKSLEKSLAELVSYFHETGYDINIFSKASTAEKPCVYIVPADNGDVVSKARASSGDMPVIAVALRYDEGEELEALSCGAHDYAVATKLISLVKRVQNHIESAASKTTFASEIEKLKHDKEVTKTEVSNLQETLLSTVAEMVEFRDIVTGGHVKRTSLYIEALIGNLKKFGIYKEETDSWDTQQVVASSMLHDVGKIKTPDAVLLKNDKLTEAEFDEIKQHTVVGANLLETIQRNMEGENRDKQYLTYAVEFARFHHEKWDGSGYPEGRKGADIPLLGRLMSIVDVYDALVSRRPYKEGMQSEKAEEIIIGGSGRAFDPLLIEVFKKTLPEFNKIRNSIGEEEEVIPRAESDDTGFDMEA